MKRILACLILVALCFSVADAHDTWLMPPIGWVGQDDNSIVPLTEGHHGVPEGAPPGAIYIDVVSPSGSVVASGEIIDEVLDVNSKKNGPYYYIGFDVAETGMYVAQAEHHEGALTFIFTKFGEEPIEEGPYADIDWDAMDKSEWDDDWYIAEAYDDVVKFTKTFLVVENSDFTSASLPVGQKLEIVPLDNLTSVGEGNFQFQVLFDGAACPDCEVSAMKAYLNDDIVGTTDDEGKVTFNLSEEGPWLIKAMYKDGDLQALDQHGPESSENSFVGTVYYHILTMRPDHEQPEAT